LIPLAAQQFDAPNTLHEAVDGDNLRHHATLHAGTTVYLPTIQHHHQLLFDFARHWPNQTTPFQA
jgi:hypothetical protein